MGDMMTSIQAAVAMRWFALGLDLIDHRRDSGKRGGKIRRRSG